MIPTRHDQAESWLAEEYVQVNADQVGSALAALDLVPELIGAGGLLADVGCGAGEVAVAMARRGMTVHASDVSPSMVAATRRLAAGLPVTATVQNANELELTPGAFTVVHSSWVLHWVARGVAAVRTMARAVRPGGALVLQYCHSQPLAEGPGMARVYQDVAGRPRWRERLAGLPFAHQQHPAEVVADVIEEEGLEIVGCEDPTSFAKGRRSGPPDLEAARRQVRLTGFAVHARALGEDRDAFVDELIVEAHQSGRSDPQGVRIIARRPGR
ncbi:class I SAM-dependent methyltransferase [Streptomyces yaizuensis]|uniref:Methyltransferase domain-containing protein n=1 Tax=Streptomyces yaizuensis TaxID=2989713 RepID=A0ABQ5PAM1_9ACTN|nr:class I SAM-dependent methyltransferase [Streptomyces sp. YSPA8]GLF99639.1 methyltransferase domain-containing protein [Streptomyces sp. YSPA8]